MWPQERTELFVKESMNGKADTSALVYTVALAQDKRNHFIIFRLDNLFRSLEVPQAM